MSIILPHFTYFPDPVKDGLIIPSKNRCACCHKNRGYVYTGPLYCKYEFDEDSICPWCIADDSMHSKYDAEFTDYDGIGGYGSWDDVSDDVKSEIAFRTPGFYSWQQGQWWTHCGDGAEFICVADKNDVLKYGELLLSILKQDSGLNDRDWEEHFNEFDKKYGPTAYIFKCRACGKYGGYSDHA